MSIYSISCYDIIYYFVLSYNIVSCPIFALSTDLPYPSLVSFAATSRAMLNDVLPLVSTLHIDKSSQLRLGLITKHLRDVRSISIYKLFQKDDTFSINQNAAVKAVHFLCRFPLLETVHFWGEETIHFSPRDYRNVCSLNSLTNVHGNLTEHDERTMNHLIDSFSGGFACGALSNSVNIIGLSCPRRLNPTRATGLCNVCKRVCKTFPLERVFDVDLCDDAYCRELIDSRQGGEDVLAAFGQRSY